MPQTMPLHYFLPPTRWGTVERVIRIELTYQAWEARVLPLNYTRDASRHGRDVNGLRAAVKNRFARDFALHAGFFWPEVSLVAPGALLYPARIP